MRARPTRRSLNACTDPAVLWYRAAVESESPLDELEVALDAMCSMKEPFYSRYHLLSSVERRVGGQGLVQFASIVNTQDKVPVPLPTCLPRSTRIDR